MTFFYLKSNLEKLFMKSDTNKWLNYANENLASAKILLESNLYNPCLQNVQQCVEKSLKALLIEKSLKLIKTHSISELKLIFEHNELPIEITDEECDFLDSIYLPSKYPISSALPYYEPDYDICIKGVSLAEKIYKSVENLLT